VTPRVAAGIAVDAEKPLDAGIESRLLAHFTADTVFRPLPELETASGERVQAEEGRGPSLDKDETAAMQEDRVHRHSGSFRAIHPGAEGHAQLRNCRKEIPRWAGRPHT